MGHSQRKAGAPATRAPAPRSQRPHDAAATRQIILDATVDLLAEKGFTALGVNSIAAAAGVDKQLIYYHFGGLAGVVRSLGGRLELWLGTPLAFEAGERYGEAVARLLTRYAHALRENELVLRLLAWELVEPTEALKDLEATRSKAMSEWMEAFRASVQAAPGEVDAPAINALLLAGLHYLALRERSVGSFAGLDISTSDGTKRITDAVRLITRTVYAERPPGASPPAQAAHQRAAGKSRRREPKP